MFLSPDALFRSIPATQAPFARSSSRSSTSDNLPFDIALQTARQPKPSSFAADDSSTARNDSSDRPVDTGSENERDSASAVDDARASSSSRKARDKRRNDSDESSSNSNDSASSADASQSDGSADATTSTPAADKSSDEKPSHKSKHAANDSKDPANPRATDPAVQSQLVTPTAQAPHPAAAAAAADDAGAQAAAGATSPLNPHAAAQLAAATSKKAAQNETPATVGNPKSSDASAQAQAGANAANDSAAQDDDPQTLAAAQNTDAPAPFTKPPHKVGKDSPDLTNTGTSATSQAATAQSTPTAADAATLSAQSAELAKTLAAANGSKDDSTPKADLSPSPLAAPAHSPLSLSSNRADAATQAQESPRTQPEQTFDQVVLGLRANLDPRNGKAEIQLNPPNLGTLHVSIALNNGSLTAQFQSSSDVVRDLLKSNMEKLKGVLESQGVAVDNLAVGAPTDKTETAAAMTTTPQNSSPENDGRSAGQYHQDSQQQRRSRDPGTFARTWKNLKDAPIDLVA